MKKIISTLCLLALCIVCFADSFTYEYYGVKFKCKTTKDEACITKFDANAEKVVFPAIIQHKGISYYVKEIDTFIGGYNYAASVVIIEEGIETIDKYSFANMRNLQTVSLPSTIKQIGKKAFRNNDGLKFYLPNSLDEMAIRRGESVDVRINEVIEDDLLAKAELARQKAGQSQAGNNNGAISTSPSNQPVKKNKSPFTFENVVSDVDKNIPTTNIKKTNTYCLIIANEKYKEVPAVQFAENDGKMFKEYCVKTLGVPEKHTRMFVDATYTDMKRAFNWISEISRVAGKGSRIIVYYAGHGQPSEEDNSSYLMPTDCFPKDLSTCFKLSNIYKRFGNLDVQSVTVFLDACFSGLRRGESETLLASRGVATRPRKETLSGNVIVFSAASNEETALAYNEKSHGLFTYYLLRKLKDTRGNVNYGDLYKSIYNEVQKNSLIENDKLQTPSVSASLSMKQWYNLNF